MRGIRAASHLSHLRLANQFGKQPWREPLEMERDFLVAGDGDLLLALVQGVQDMASAGFGGHALLDGVIHAPVFLPVAAQRVQRDLRAYKARTNQRDVDVFVVDLGTQGVKIAVQRVLGGAIR